MAFEISSLGVPVRGRLMAKFSGKEATTIHPPGTPSVFSSRRLFNHCRRELSAEHLICFSAENLSRSLTIYDVVESRTFRAKKKTEVLELSRRRSKSFCVVGQSSPWQHLFDIKQAMKIKHPVTVVDIDKLQSLFVFFSSWLSPSLAPLKCHDEILLRHYNT